MKSRVSRETAHLDREKLAAGFGKRLRDALHILQEREFHGRKLSGRKIGLLIEPILGENRTANAVLDWRNGKAIPDVYTLVALATVLGVNPGWLVFGEGEMGAREGAEERRPRVAPTDLTERTRRVNEAEEKTGQEEEA